MRLTGPPRPPVCNYRTFIPCVVSVSEREKDRSREGIRTIEERKRTKVNILNLLCSWKKKKLVFRVWERRSSCFSPLERWRGKCLAQRILAGSMKYLWIVMLVRFRNLVGVSGMKAKVTDRRFFFFFFIWRRKYIKVRQVWRRIRGGPPPTCCWDARPAPFLKNYILPALRHTHTHVHYRILKNKNEKKEQTRRKTFPAKERIAEG